MSSGESASRVWTSRATRLRHAFDSAFEAPAAPPHRAGRRLLLVDVGGLACAVAMDECSAVQRAAGIARLPARIPAFAGLTTIGGTVLPVYDLAARLGLRGADDSMQWLVVSAGQPRVAFLVGGIDGYAERTEETGSPTAPSPGNPAAASVEASVDTGPVVTVDDRARRLIDIVTVVESIERDLRRADMSEENTAR